MPLSIPVRFQVLTASASVLLLPVLASAEPLNPLEFPSAGAVTLAAGQLYTIDTAAGTLTGGLLNLTGTFRGSTLVFSFDSLTVQPNLVFNVTGRKPVALLSRGDLVFGAILTRSGANGAAGTTSSGGQGGNGAGTGGGGSVTSVRNPGGGTGGGDSPLFGFAAGGSFGGRAAGTSNTTYGNLLLNLEVGSGGAGFWGSASAAGGGAGGGAIELGALGTLTMTMGATLAADGGNSSNGSFSGGGGSGGGILLHASTVQIQPSVFVSAKGGSSGSGQGGGGGRIAIQSVNAPSLTGFNVSGGGGTAQPGVITSARITLVAPDLDFGDVAVGSTRTLFMAARNTGDPDTSINGQFPDAASPFARVDTGIFSSVRPGRAAANDYKFTPTSTGTFTQQLTFISNAGPVTVNVSGRGVLPTCLGDLNNDGAINTVDLTQFLGLFGAPCP